MMTVKLEVTHLSKDIKYYAEIVHRTVRMPSEHSAEASVLYVYAVFYTVQLGVKVVVPYTGHCSRGGGRGQVCMHACVGASEWSVEYYTYQTSLGGWCTVWWGGGWECALDLGMYSS